MKGETTCSTCHAPVIWVHTQAGRLMPVDITPVQGFEFEQVAADGVQTVGPLKRVYVSHFATCPQAAQHRRPK